MTVKKTDLTPGYERERAARAARLDLTSLMAGLAALAFGLPLWLVSARYTLDGWVIALNLLADFLRIPGTIPLPSGWWVLLLIPVGLIYSWVEIRAVPVGQMRLGLRAFLVLVFLAVLISDVGSTFLGVIAPPAAGAWPISAWLSQTLWAAFSWALILTFIPERLMMLGVWLVRRTWDD